MPSAMAVPGMPLTPPAPRSPGEIQLSAAASPCPARRAGAARREAEVPCGTLSARSNRLSNPREHHPCEQTTVGFPLRIAIGYQARYRG